MNLALVIFILVVRTVLSESILEFPVSKDYIVHSGESFCDEMYYFSYGKGRNHTAIDLIKKWKKEHIVKSPKDIHQLKQIHEKVYSYLPTESSFYNDDEKLFQFLKINLYRAGYPIIDTNLGLYPKSTMETDYGYGETFVSVYDGFVEDEVRPNQVQGWGKAILISHNAPKGYTWSFTYKDKIFIANTFWTQFSHNAENFVKKGDKVSKGQKLGTIGDGNGIFNSVTGKKFLREGAHLHFEVRIKKFPLFPPKEILDSCEKWDGIYVDPLEFFRTIKLTQRE
ncbi:MAG: M23 family metallopeptidase [Leptospiraceae bacterium]|nr:M23 family metallopeptidase [Leptospiraceae bacterium]